MNTEQKPESSIGSAERRWLLGLSVFVIVLTTIPYLVGYLVQGEGWVFTGFVFNVEDGNSYIAKMLTGSYGAWLFRTPYTTVPQDGLLAFLPYLLLGKLTVPRGDHFQLVLLFHLFRFAGIVCYVFATHRFVSLFLASKVNRRWVVVLITLGGGFGWLLALLGRAEWLGSLPLDFISPESFGFLSLYGLPHLAVTRALFLWGLFDYLRYSELSSSNGTRAGLLWLLASFFQPLTIAIAWVLIAVHLFVLAAYEFWRSRSAQADWARWRAYFIKAVVAVTLSSPLVLYTVYVSRASAFMRAWTAQNILPSPHPLHYLLAYLLFLPFVVIGVRAVLRKDFLRAIFLVAWLVALPLLVYAPVSVQRRLGEGVFVAVVILAISPFEAARPLQARWRYAFLLAFPTTLFLLFGGFLAALNPAAPIFRPSGEIAAYRALSETAAPGEIVLTSFEVGNNLPAWTPQRVVIGHGPESIGLEQLRPRVSVFFQSDTGNQERIALLDEFEVGYVFWGPFERALGGWDPTSASYLQLVYQSGDYALLEVVR